VRVPGLGQDDCRHQRSETPDPRAVRGADHAIVQVCGHMAQIVRTLATAADPVAAS